MSATTARQYALRLLRTMDRQTPIDVEGLAQSLGLTIHRTEIPDGISGLLVTRGAISTICVQKTDSEQRQRFTIAHELGHWCLKHQQQSGEHVHVNRGNMVSERGRLSASGVDAKEVEANQFAAELIMPAQLVRKAVETRKKPLLDRDISDLATHFNVSEQAIGFRLRNLKLA